MRLLLVEDDAILGEGLRDFLANDDHRVTWVKSLSEARLAAKEPFDCLLLDWNLPDGPGIGLLADLRAKGNSTPAIILTARDTLGDRIMGLDSGADDYLIKPFAPEELSARLRSLGRRLTGGSRLRFLGGIEIDIHGKLALKDGVSVELTAREWSVLIALAQRIGRVVSKSTLQQLIQSPGDSEIISNAIEVHIFNLRSKLGKGFIETSRGLGYRISPNALDPASAG